MSDSQPERPEIHCDRFHATLAVRDVLAAVDFYTTKLGFEFGFTWGEPVTFAGVNLGEVQIFLAQRDGSGSALHFVIDDADALYEFHVRNGAEVAEPIDDRDYGFRDYAVRDLDENVLAFGHYIYTVGPPLEIERVDVPVRMEKRLAALLDDLARHKRMSVSECLEEIVLHTSERLGDGVPSPHTRSQLRHIEELKEKHGIDYDTHASYRFVEKADGDAT